MNIYEANMFDSRKLNLRLITNALKLDKQLTSSYSIYIYKKMEILRKNRYNRVGSLGGNVG